MKAYVSGAYARKDELKEFALHLEALGIEITSHWLDEKYAPSTRLDEVPVEELEHMCDTDVDEVIESDFMVFFSESVTQPRGGRHVEMGMALILHHPVFVIGPKENIFHHHSNVVHFDSKEKFLNVVATFIK